MTKWEIGQDLIAISDYIAEKEVDFRKSGETRIANNLHIIRMQIGEIFNHNNDHDFSILDVSDVKR